MINHSIYSTEPSAQTPAPPASYNVPTKFTINKLIKTIIYEYEIELDGNPGNWPVVVVPRSGEFIATSRTKEIDALVIFCPNTGVCDSGNPDVLPFNLDYSCGLQNNLLFTNLRVKVNEKNSNEYIYSNTRHIECTDCLKPIDMSLLGVNLKNNENNNSLMLTEATENVIKLQTKFLNVMPGQQYSWSFSRVTSNWPVTVTPASGTFTASNHEYVADSVLTFCRDSSCSGINGYMTYNTSNFSNDYKFITLNVTINNNDRCHFNNNTKTLSVYCNDCIPTPKVSFGSENILTTKPCTDISVSLSGLESYKTYLYNFSTYRANWPTLISPISGSFATSYNHDTSLPFKLSFCGSEAICSGDANLLSYNIDYNKLYTNTECDKFAYIKFNLSTQNEPGTNLLVNNLLKIHCDDCINTSSNNLPTISKN